MPKAKEALDPYAPDREPAIETLASAHDRIARLEEEASK